MRHLPESIECVTCRQLAGKQILCTLVDEPLAADDEAADDEATDDEAADDEAADDEANNEESVLHSPDVAGSGTVHQNRGYRIFRDPESERDWIWCEGGQWWFFVFHSPDDARLDSMHRNGGYEIYRDPESERDWIWYARTEDWFFLPR